jgi:hypothetical protein
MFSHRLKKSSKVSSVILLYLSASSYWSAALCVPSTEDVLRDFDAQFAHFLLVSLVSVRYWFISCATLNCQN